MCLYVNNKKVRVAKKDIVCYKIVIKERKKWIYRIFHKPTYRAPFYNYYTYQLKKRYCLRNCLNHHVFTTYPEHQYTVSVGFHSFVDIQDAKRMLSRLYDVYGNRGRRQTIVQCVIPKGAEYVKGTIDLSENSPASYVSDEIICVKEV